MPANSSLNLTSLDFDTLKNDLKTYLKSQSVFKDYDYEGSNMNVLLSVLSYNTYLNSFYLNMVASESFLDTAQLLDSVISHSKLLNYTPSSAKSPKALIDLTYTVIDNSIQNNFLIPKGAQFSGTNANGAFTYVTDRNHNLVSSNGVFTIKGLEIYEGSYINESFVVDNNEETQRFIISNPNIDTNSLVLTVFEDNASVSYDYIMAKNLYGLNSNSTVFFLQAYQNKYEVVFGDGVFGRKPQNNATILASYRITNGTRGGGISTFFADQDLGSYNGGYARPTITINTMSDSGAEAESIESVRFRAPKSFQAQGRAITRGDYKTIIMDEFPEVKALNVFGGESANSISGINYGKVFISPITYAGTGLTENKKQEVITYIKDKMTIGLTPVIVNPDTLYIGNAITVKYNQNYTNYTPGDIGALVTQSVSNFNDAYLKDFDTTFRFSKLVEAIDASDPSILSSSTTTTVKKIASPPLNKVTTIDYNFHQEILPGTITSTSFLLSDGLTYSFTDYNPLNVTFVQASYQNIMYVENTTNVLYLKLNDPTKQLYIPVGTIDYLKGTITISSIIIADFLSNPGIVLTTETALDDIIAVDNDLIEISMADTTVTVVPQ